VNAHFLADARPLYSAFESERGTKRYGEEKEKESGKREKE